MDTAEPGTFCWVELAVPELDAARSFYRNLLGWEVDEETLSSGEGYARLRLRGSNLGGLHSLPRRLTGNGPLQWVAHLAVADLTSSTARAEQLGARVLSLPFEVPSVGIAVLLEDPSGARIALCQPGEDHHPCPAGPGSLGWMQLLTAAPDRARAFYAALLDWRTEIQELPSGPVTTFLVGQRRVAGMAALGASAGSVSPHWLVHFSVNDCDLVSQRASELGGQLIIRPTAIPGVGRFAALADPQGAAFAVLGISPAGP